MNDTAERYDRFCKRLSVRPFVVVVLLVQIAPARVFCLL